MSKWPMALLGFFVLLQVKGLYAENELVHAVASPLLLINLIGLVRAGRTFTKKGDR